MISIAICDDEKAIIEQLRDMIRSQLLNSHISEYLSGEELLCSDEKFSIVFLDIQMENMNGIQVAKKLREKGNDSIIIFVTAVKEYVFEAFDVAAFHYLLKPIETEKMNTILKRALAEIAKKGGDEVKKLFIKTRYVNRTLSLNEIMYLENQKRKIILHTLKENIEFYATMSDLEEQLGIDFYRCHRGYLVNMAYIIEYTVDSIRLKNGENIYLSKEKYQGFVKQYMRYLRNGGNSLE